MRYARRLGLAKAYLADERIQRIIRSYLSLPLLPHELIIENVIRINYHILDNDLGLSFITYILCIY